MSEHRYPCDAREPRLFPTSCGHRHACIHDAEDHPGRMVEHRCECGMTWTRRPGGALSIEAERDLLARQREQVLAHVHQWLKDHAYAPDDIVLSSHSSLDDKAFRNIHRLLDGIDPTWRTIFPDEEQA